MNTKLVVSILALVCGVLAATLAHAQMGILNDGVKFPDGTVQTSASHFGPHGLDDLLVVAYTNVDGIPGYSTADRLIAAIVDVNGDNIVSIGDEIRTNGFPDLNGVAKGAFKVRQHSITSLVTVDSTDTFVTSFDSEFFFKDNGITCGNGCMGDYYIEKNKTTDPCPGSTSHDRCPNFIQVTDVELLGATGNGDDIVEIKCGELDFFIPWICPSFPSQTQRTFEQLIRAGDQDFIDVDILYIIG